MHLFLLESAPAHCVRPARPKWRSAAASAIDEPNFNMGGTSFFDGGEIPGGPGNYFIEYLGYYLANNLMENCGSKEIFAQPKNQPHRAGQPVDLRTGRRKMGQ